MVSLDTDARRVDGVTLVTARVAPAPVDRRLRLVNALDGPVWPPRTNGVPVAGWDADGYETVLPAGESLAVGYATPAEPAEPPVRVASVATVDADAAPTPAAGADERRSSAADEPDAATAARELGDPAPPRDALPVPVASSTDQQSGSGEPSTERPAVTDGTDADRHEADPGSDDQSDRPRPPASDVAAELATVAERLASVAATLAADGRGRDAGPGAGAEP